LQTGLARADCKWLLREGWYESALQRNVAKRLGCGERGWYEAGCKQAGESGLR